MSERSTVKRKPERGSTDRDEINRILDEALFCHVGFVDGGSPVVIPTIHARRQATIYFHGSPASRMLRLLKEGAELCLTATILDGLVMARSVFNHSMNYRSVVVFGTPREVTDPGEKASAFEAITEHVARGRWEDARRPTEHETRATLVVAIDFDEASAKIRRGPPVDDAEDVELDIWAGVVPVSEVYGTPIPAPDLKPGLQTPDYLSNYAR